MHARRVHLKFAVCQERVLRRSKFRTNEMKSTAVVHELMENKARVSSGSKCCLYRENMILVAR